MRNFLRFMAAVHLLLMQSLIPDWWALIVWTLFFASFAREKLRREFPAFMTSFAVEIAGGLFSAVAIALIRPIVGIEASAALIYLFVALELFRLDTRRSQWRFLFLLLTSLSLILLDFTGWLSIFFLIGDLIIIFQLMTAFEVGDTQLSFGGLRAAFTLVASSFPLWICIFLLFPRFSIELWGKGEAPAEVGFSESLEVGTVENVVKTSEVAFRFRWRGSRPVDPLYYFRGAVLEAGEGLSWHLDAKSAVWERPDPKEVGFEQEIWGNPKNGRALIGLDRPLAVEVPSEQVEAFESLMFRLKRPPLGTFFYRAWSSVAVVPHLLSPPERERLTKVSDRLKKEIVAWWDKRGNWEQFRKLPSSGKMRVLQQLFRKEKFRYSLSPPALQSGAMLEFLTTTRTGFCEHFAATTATLLRAAGVPARVVVGFLGGQEDPFTADWVVMAREAHAWVEYYNEQTQDWTRLDPTLWIEPLRWDLGADVNWLTPEMREQFALHGDKLLPWWPRIQERMRLAWDASFGAGERWVVSYNTEWMKSALSPLGGEKYSDAFSFVLLLGGLGAVMALVPWLRSKLRARNPWEVIWRSFEKRMRIPVQKNRTEARTWSEFSETVDPVVHAPAQSFVDYYLRARYQDPTSTWNREKKNALSLRLRKIPRRRKRNPGDVKPNPDSRGVNS